jgi:type II secretory pathway pseudopilin PulG
MRSLIRGKKGYTLIEMMPVIVISIIIAAAAFTLQGKFMVNAYLDSDSEAVVQKLRVAQTRSMTGIENSEWGVYFDNAEDKVVLFKGSNYSTRDTAFDEETEFKSSIDLSFVSLNGGGDEVIFERVSGITTQHGSVEISNNISEANTISISPEGTVDLNPLEEDTDGGEDDDDDDDNTDPPTTAAGDLIIDISDAEIKGGSKKELKGLTATNNGDSDITIAKITGTWTGGKKIEQIKLDKTYIWKHSGTGSPSGRQVSGTELDVVDYTISPGETLDFDKIKFNGNMEQENFTFLFEMSDSSTTSINIFPEDDDDDDDDDDD